MSNDDLKKKAEEIVFGALNSEGVKNDTKKYTDEMTKVLFSEEISHLPQETRAAVFAIMLGRIFGGYVATTFDISHENSNDNPDLAAYIMQNWLGRAERQMEKLSEKANVPLSVQFGAPSSVDQLNKLLDEKEDQSKAC